MGKRMLMSAALLCLFAFSASAQEQALDREPGYLDFGNIEAWFGEEASVEVNVKGALLRLVAEASRGEDPDLATLLSRLKAVQVRVYNLTPEEAKSATLRARDLGKRLERTGWETVARVREEDEDVHMYVKSGARTIEGLMVMVLSPGEQETVFVNIVGDIDPAEIGRIGRKFNIHPLDGMSK